MKNTENSTKNEQTGIVLNPWSRHISPTWVWQLAGRAEHLKCPGLPGRNPVPQTTNCPPRPPPPFLLCHRTLLISEQPCVQLLKEPTHPSLATRGGPLMWKQTPWWASGGSLRGLAQLAGALAPSLFPLLLPVTWGISNGATVAILQPWE